MGDGFGVSIAHDGHQIFQKGPVIVKVTLLLDKLLAPRKVAGEVFTTGPCGFSFRLSRIAGMGVAVKRVKSGTRKGRHKQKRNKKIAVKG